MFVVNTLTLAVSTIHFIVTRNLSPFIAVILMILAYNICYIFIVHSQSFEIIQLIELSVVIIYLIICCLLKILFYNALDYLKNQYNIYNIKVNF